jgi:[protein-PII] uridylyltransferase
MRDLYTHSRNIYLITRTIEERLALQPEPARLPGLGDLIRPFRKPPPPSTVDGFLFAKGQVRAAEPLVFKSEPRRLMRVFLYAQQRGVRLHPDLVPLIREDLPLVKRGFRTDEHIRATFLEILSQRGSVSRVLRAMHEVGLLGKYIPEFGKLTNLVQHEFYHQYAADEHTVVCLEKLDALWEAAAPGGGHYAEIFKHVERPFVIYLALLLHDVGKAENYSNHAAAGARAAESVAKRLALEGTTSESLRLLIEHHLTMAAVSQRRDLEDPAVISQFAAVVQTPENLRMLTLLTVADTLATSDKLWNGFKDLLLTELYRKTLNHLEEGTDLVEMEARQREVLAEEVGRLVPKEVEPAEVAAHFRELPARYFEIHPAREIAIDIHLAHRFMRHVLETNDERALEPIVQWRTDPDRGYSSAKVCTWDRAGLFSTLAGSFSASGINILSAQIFTRNDGIVIDTFEVTDARQGGPVSKEDCERFENIVSRALTLHPVDFPALIAKAKPARSVYQSLDGERIPTHIRFDRQPSDERTVIDIETEDRLGLLYVLSKVLSKLGVDIALAKIFTEKGAAIDTFYVVDRLRKRVMNKDRQRQVADALRGALAAME